MKKNNIWKIITVVLVLFILMLILLEGCEDKIPFESKFVSSTSQEKCTSNLTCPETCYTEEGTGETACIYGLPNIIYQKKYSPSESGDKPNPSPSPSGTNPAEEPIEPLMDSENYAVVWDSINVGGGYSTSESYWQESTVGEIGTGYTGPSENYGIHAGYQQIYGSYISISDPPDIDLGTLGGLVGGTVSGNTSATVKTDYEMGYTLFAKASTSPALKSLDDEFDDYTPFGAVPDYEWSVDPGSAEFGFSAFGDDLAQFFKYDDGYNCDAGANKTSGKCWYNFSTSDLKIAGSNLPNHPAGTSTTVNVKAQSSDHFLLDGTYTATITLTAITN